MVNARDAVGFAGLALTGNQLTGTLPPSLFTLGRLDTINLYEPLMYISAA